MVVLRGGRKKGGEGGGPLLIGSFPAAKSKTKSVRRGCRAGKDLREGKLPGGTSGEDLSELRGVIFALKEERKEHHREGETRAQARNLFEKEKGDGRRRKV